MTEYFSLWDSSSFIESSTIEDCSGSFKEVEGDCVFIFTHSYTCCGSLNHWLYLHKIDEVISNPYTLDSGPVVAPNCHDDPVVLDEYNNNTVSTLDEYYNNNHVRKIEN